MEDTPSTKATPGKKTEREEKDEHILLHLYGD